MAAMVLYLCGVSREDIAADYMVSSLYNTNGINRELLAQAGFSAEKQKLLKETFTEA